jgi:4-amino-4-deoxy-L-arabinose transferase-like glycosyltransferase
VSGPAGASGVPGANGSLWVRLEAWWRLHVVPAALIVLLCSVAVDLSEVLGCSLRPDEAFLFTTANGDGFVAAYLKSRTHPHPPLYVLLLHAVLAVGNDEFVLRLPSLVAGTLASWVAFRWLQRAAGDAAALLGLALLAFSPAMVAAASEARQYALLLLFLTAALYCMERFLGGRSAAWGAGYAGALWGAILTHYTAAWVTVAVGVYVPLRLWRDRLPRALWVVWLGSQAGAAVLYVWLYRTHLAWLRGSANASQAMSGWLEPYYYQPGEPVVSFVASAIAGAFQYIAGGRLAGLLVLACFAMGLVLILFRALGGGTDEGGPRARDGATRVRRDYALLLSLPLVIGCAGAVIRVLPFGNTRHVAYLLPFVAAAAAVGVAGMPRAPLRVLMGAGLLLVWLWAGRAAPASDACRLARTDVFAALRYLQTAAPQDATVFVDGQTHLVLWYYLAPTQSALSVQRHQTVNETPLGGYRVMSLERSWSFAPEGMLADLRTLAAALGLRPDDAIWVVALGWDHPDVGSQLPPQALLERRNFGRITVLKVAAERW